MYLPKQKVNKRRRGNQRGRRQDKMPTKEGV
jgi:hypothetical protein